MIQKLLRALIAWLDKQLQPPAPQSPVEVENDASPSPEATTPSALHALIRRFEGLRLKPYLCPAGVPTIGYGSTAYGDGHKVKLTDKPISAPVAEAMMQRDAEVFSKAAAVLSPVLRLHENKHAAIADFCYNLGTTRYKASTLRRRVDANDWPGAQEELAKWIWGGGKKLPGLILRRKAEALLVSKH